MKNKRDFLKYCLTLIQLNAMSARTLSDNRHDQLTLMLFYRLIDITVRAFEQVSLLPMMVPVMMLIRGMLPIDSILLAKIQKDFLRMATQHPFVATNIRTEIFNILCEQHEKLPGIFTAKFIEQEKNQNHVLIEAFHQVFCAMLFDKKPVIALMIDEDAQSLEKQINPASYNRLHAYTEQSRPVSKAYTLFHLNNSMLNIDPVRHFRFASVIPWTEGQTGQTCKLHAAHAAAWALYLASPETTPCPPPVHRHAEMPDGAFSLVQQAKALYNCQVGEVYSPRYLIKLMNNNGFNNVKIIQADHDTYIQKLKNIIDKGNVGLIYYDTQLNPNKPSPGFPCKEGGAFEHSAVVWGYFSTENNQEYFCVYQWDRYYLFPKTHLLESTAQLQRRTGEVFYNIGNTAEEKWIDLHRARSFEPDNYKKIIDKEYIEKRITLPPPKDYPTFRYCIVSFGPNQVLKEEADFKTTFSKSK